MKTATLCDEMSDRLLGTNLSIRASLRCVDSHERQVLSSRYRQSF